MNKTTIATIGLMVATLLSKILGFGRELILASSYGTSIYSDAYLTAMNIPIVIFASIGGAIATTFIPLYFECNNNDHKGNLSLKFTNNVVNIVIIVSLSLALLGFIYTEQLVKLFAIGFKGQTLQITIEFTRILIIGVLFIGLSNIMTAYLQANGNFILPGMISIPYNIIIIVSIILSTHNEPKIMVWGTLIGIACQFLMQLICSYKYKYRYKLYVNINDDKIKKMFYLLGPIFVGIAINQINTMIDRNLASTLVQGSISALNYANKLNGFIMSIFIASVVSVIYPMLSKLSSENNKEEFNKSIVKSINIIILLVIPISVGAIILASPIIKILFERGEFDYRATYMTSVALIFYSIGLIGFGLRDILTKIFYSIHDTKTPLINGTISVVLNIILNIILVKIMGHAGLALATSLSSIICILLLFGSLKKKIGYFGQDKIMKIALKSIASAISMGVVTYLSYNLLSGMLGAGFITEAISLFGSILIGAIVYGMLVVILKVEEVSVITDMIKNKLKK